MLGRVMEGFSLIPLVMLLSAPEWTVWDQMRSGPSQLWTGGGVFVFEHQLKLSQPFFSISKRLCCFERLQKIIAIWNRQTILEVLAKHGKIRRLLCRFFKRRCFAPIFCPSPSPPWAPVRFWCSPSFLSHGRTGRAAF
jgi:hypothetical protein